MADTMQPEVNIGLVGHVDHGKTTLTERLSGKWTDTHSEELKRGITIRLGYADCVIRSIKGKKGVDQYTTLEEVDGKQTDIVRKISLIDAPGHESLMATMLSGASLMDGAILLVAANEHCPQPQTVEHLMALQVAGIKNVIVVQNKIDVVSVERAQKNYEQIRAFLEKTEFKDAPVVPVSALQDVNIDALMYAIQEVVPTPARDLQKSPLFYVARSFDINKPGSRPEKLKGGVLGGSIVQGQFSIGDELEIRPGRVVEEQNQKVAHSLTTKVVSLVSGGESSKTLTPGGSSAIMTSLDPGLVKSDSLVGSVVGKPGTLPPVWYSFRLKTSLLERVVGVEGSVEPLKLKELLMLNVHSAATVGVVTELGKDEISVSLKKPVCASKGDRISISRRTGTRFRLIGFGVILGDQEK